MIVYNHDSMAEDGGMTYCTILSDGTGAPHRQYPTREAALTAARRLHRRRGVAVEVAWCRAGVPKLWLAFVTLDGIARTERRSAGE